MSIKVPLECSPKRYDYERCHDDSQYCVGSQDREIDRPNDAFAGEFGRAKAIVVCSDRMVGNIANKEQSRDNTGRDHAKAVETKALSKDKKQPTHKAQAA